MGTTYEIQLYKSNLRLAEEILSDPIDHKRAALYVISYVEELANYFL